MTGGAAASPFGRIYAKDSGAGERFATAGAEGGADALRERRSAGDGRSLGKRNGGVGVVAYPRSVAPMAAVEAHKAANQRKGRMAILPP